MPVISVRQEKIYYAARGSGGAPLVFVHGAGDSHLVWNGQLAACAGLAQGFAVDLPRHGRSGGAGRRHIADYADLLVGWMDAVGLADAILVGVSMGGAIAQQVALSAPSRVRGLVLAATGAKLRVLPEFLQGLESDFDATTAQLVTFFYAQGAASPFAAVSLDHLRETGKETVVGDFAACDAFDVRERLGEIHCPTLVICGSEDKMTPLRYSEYLAAHIAGAELNVIPDAGHLVMVEQPERFNAILTGWLSQQFV